MAQIVKRVCSDEVRYQVEWRLGGSRDGRWQSETFVDRRAARKFKADVEAYDTAGPKGG